MANEMRDRLVEILLQKTCHYSDTPCDKECGVCGNVELYKSDIESVADHLIANGVIVPPCKVGDKTFLLLETITGRWDIVESKCVRITDNGYGKYYSMAIDCKEIGNTLECGICDFGKWVFLTKEAAEQKLKEMWGE